MERKRRLEPGNYDMEQAKLKRVTGKRDIIEQIKSNIQHLTSINPPLPEELIFNILRYVHNTDDVVLAFQELGRQILF